MGSSKLRSEISLRSLLAEEFAQDGLGSLFFHISGKKTYRAYAEILRPSSAFISHLIEATDCVCETKELHLTLDDVTPEDLEKALDLVYFGKAVIGGEEQMLEVLSVLSMLGVSTDVELCDDEGANNTPEKKVISTDKRTFWIGFVLFPFSVSP